MSGKGFYDSLIHGVVGTGRDQILNSSKLPEIKECCSLLEEIYTEQNGKKLSINIDLPDNIIKFGLELYGFMEYSHGDSFTKLLERSKKFAISKQGKGERDVILLEFYISFKEVGQA